MKNTIAKLVAAAVAAASLGMVLPSAGAADRGEKTVRIMPVGDSITDGYWEQGGYRKYLSYTLAQKGYTNIDFVGPKGSDRESFTYNGKEVNYDGNYAGYSGYAIQNMNGAEPRSGILETLSAGDYIKEYSPDIVLPQIGTNDIISSYNDGAAERLENLINYILSEGSPDQEVFVTTIPDMDAVTAADWFWSYGEVKWNSTKEEFAAIVQDYVDTYNASVAELVRKMQSEGKNVRFGDINSVLDASSDLYDGVHPNEAGYEKMGLYWAEVLDGYLGSQNVSEPASGEIIEKEYEVADLVALASHLLGRKQERITAANFSKYDLTQDGKLNVYDLILLRRKLFS